MPTKSYTQHANAKHWFTRDPVYCADPKRGLGSLFPPGKRKFVATHEFLGLTIATMHTGKPLYMVGSIPVYALYFVLDDFGDNALPIDTAFISPWMALTAVQAFAYVKNARGVRDPFKDIGTYLGRAANMQSLMPDFFKRFTDLFDWMIHLDAEWETPESIKKQLANKLAWFISRTDEVGIFVEHEEF